MEADLKWLTNPEVFQVNREEAHSDHIAYSNEEEIKIGKTSLRQYLNGKWRFLFSETIKERPTDFINEDSNIDDFEEIMVPGHIELQGYGQIQYINTLYPWDGHSQIYPPDIDPDRTTVGTYIRNFDLDSSLIGKDIYISFQGVEKAFYVWLNGKFVGYSEDSFTPSEFNLTPYIKDKDNRLCVQVFQNSSASWLEDQDMFRFSGIFRDVYLFAKPEVHLDDVWFKTDVQKNEGKLQLRLKISSKEENYSISFSLNSPNGKELINQELRLEKEGNILVSEEFTIPDVVLWDHQKPNLYSTLLTLKNNKNEIIEVIPYKIGFRKLELKSGIITLNGERLFLKGVNRHEWNPNKGRALEKEDMDRDMALLIDTNSNAVRTSHYPNQSYWYELCDRNGIYMIDETNLETHGSWQKLMKVEPSWNVPGDLPEWKEVVLDRAKSMFERDKNHPSILFWSVGNESFAGANLMAMADYFRENDSSRLVHYEGSFHNREWDDISDVESQMYAPPETIIEYLENNPKKPFILCEFMHDMGNSLGGLETYMKLGDKYDQYQGGFIWDFKDQALWLKDKKGNVYLGYGGDFGERQSDYNFSGNGILFADSKEKPAIQEVKYWYLPKEERVQFDLQNQREKEKLSKKIETKLKNYLNEEQSPLNVIKGDGGVGIKGKNFEILFSQPEGGPVSFKKGKNEWIWRAPKPTFWRAPTENDIGNQFAHKSSIWQAVDNHLIAQPYKLEEQNENQVTISYQYLSPLIPELSVEVRYQIYSNGLIKIKTSAKIPDNAPPIARFGLSFQTFKEIDEFKWIGIENETYPDRKQGVFGEFKSKPVIPDYLYPQESGNHTETLFVSVKNEEDKLEIIYSEKPFDFSIIPYTFNQLQEAYHKHELPVPVRSVITVCGFMRGVGGIDSWGSDVEESVQLNEKEYQFEFYIK